MIIKRWGRLWKSDDLLFEEFVLELLLVLEGVLKWKGRLMKNVEMVGVGEGLIVEE